MDVPSFPRQHHAGFTLIEVMVAFFVLSVGLFGIAGLHLSSLRDNNSALQRSRAVVLATDMLDRVRSNSAAYVDYATTYEADGTNGECHTDDTTPAENCTATDMARHDIWKWKRLISDFDESGTEPPTGLPEGRGKIVVIDDTITPALKTVTVTIQWKEGEDLMSHAMTTQIWPSGS